MADPCGDAEFRRDVDTATEDVARIFYRELSPVYGREQIERRIDRDVGGGRGVLQRALSWRCGRSDPSMNAERFFAVVAAVRRLHDEKRDDVLQVKHMRGLGQEIVYLVQCAKRFPRSAPISRDPTFAFLEQVRDFIVEFVESKRFSLDESLDSALRTKSPAFHPSRYRGYRTWLMDRLLAVIDEEIYSCLERGYVAMMSSIYSSGLALTDGSFGDMALRIERRWAQARPEIAVNCHYGARRGLRRPKRYAVGGKRRR